MLFNPYTMRVSRTALISWEPNLKHDHHFWEFVIVQKGETEHYVNDQKHVMRAGDTILLRPSDFHYFKLLGEPSAYEHRDIYVTVPDMKSICAMLGSDIYNSLLNAAEPWACFMDEKTAGAVEQRLKKFENLELIGQTPNTSMMFKSIVGFILGLLLEKKWNAGNYPGWLIAFLEKLNTVDNLKLPLEEIVKLSGFSHSRLCVLFKRYVGVTLVSYVVRLKLDHSVLLLRTTDLSMLEISSFLGYDSLSHYISIFRKKFGISPNKYRNAAGLTDLKTK